MIKLNEVVDFISRGKLLSDDCKDSNGEFYSLRLTHIKDDGTIIYDEDYKYNIENKSNLLYLYGVKNNDLIFPELTRGALNIKVIKDVDKDNVIYSQRVIFARVNQNKYNPIFLANILNSDKYNKLLLENAYHQSKGYSNTYQIRIENLKNIEIPDISIEEQNKIVEEDIKIKNQIEELKNKLSNIYNI